MMWIKCFLELLFSFLLISFSFNHLHINLVSDNMNFLLCGAERNLKNFVYSDIPAIANRPDSGKTAP